MVQARKWFDSISTWGYTERVPYVGVHWWLLQCPSWCARCRRYSHKSYASIFRAKQLHHLCEDFSWFFWPLSEFSRLLKWLSDTPWHLSPLNTPKRKRAKMKINWSTKPLCSCMRMCLPSSTTWHTVSNFYGHQILKSTQLLFAVLLDWDISMGENLRVRQMSHFQCFIGDTGGRDFSPWVYPEIHTYDDEAEEK